MNTKTSKTALWVAIITAVGSLGKVWVDSRGSDKLQMVVAAEVARNDQRWQSVERLIEAQAETHRSLVGLREAVAGLKVSVTLLAQHQRHAARSTVKDVTIPEPRPTKARAAADALLGAGGVKPAQVQMVRQRLFD